MAAKKKDSTKNAPSFEEIIHAARDRRRKQASTDKFFSKVRSENAPAAKRPAQKEAPRRIEKRTATRGARATRNAEPARTAHTRTADIPRYTTREARLLSSALPDPDLSIKGRATGPTIVLGSNFAPGTTAEDIQSAFEPVGGRMLRCRLIATYPAVMAEMMFADRRGADDVVTKFNNQKADGRILHIRIKPEIT
ncbi:hypothetical protein D8B26_004187 [Coccidioides posadasii str. Silveira]|uniref:Uncharacterized protein n=3 Tax=Coccidioides posadasii TaxID=199306 RepID=E9DJ93_COCPS|nr:hypothetical protein CPC735_041590 [Coccidioides posadasii C735 delta SOWgp]EER25715.1 hypothetical protein CPC735_041590 [Coccidioides posadasii C735 delta SOWgp]EFW13545.1 conserved hypothetical protein [Coccidioides posadasii str. Silveira]KMM69359.1 hypothetical protein CPAG_05676 [Coccidioides posadasii RMSCC 3488]QVM09529.1 hypothetical protein D8B26_004187 [Coccidioides posadasii str. Silveira]|eukprot:XP_003067860.1 hypothetical protein CPC735_041590 [Coccidioides posadasii C735 delta SOWgp]